MSPSPGLFEEPPAPPPISRNLSPLGILVSLAVMIFLSEMVAMIFISFLDLPNYWVVTLLDGLIMILLILPGLYYLQLNPLRMQINERTRVEQEMRANQGLLRKVLELLPIGVWIIDKSGNIVHGNPASQNIWAGARYVGIEHYDEYKGWWVETGKRIEPDEWAATRAIMRGETILNEEIEIECFDGSHKIILNSATPIHNNGTIRGVIAVNQDITERKHAENTLRQSEEKFRTFVDWTYDWEKWMDPHGNIVYTSPSSERITGYTPKEFTADPNLLVRIVHPDDRQFYEEHQKIIHDASAGPISIEYRIIARDGSEHWIEHICRPLFAPDDRYLGRRVSDRDITDRKQAEKKIIEQTQKELSLTQTVQTIQTDIARDLHDTLGQNISFLRMNLEYLSEAQLRDLTNVKIQIQNMAKAANESYDLIRAMLAILQTENLTDPQSLFTRYAGQIAERSSFQNDITSQGQPKQLSPHQIRQLFYIFREALSNIEKYANAGQVSGEFIWEEHALRLVISNNGRGFDPHAVQPTGHYGLKFMRERAEQLKGSFSVQSAAGQGTTITVSVPYEIQMATLSQS